MPQFPQLEGEWSRIQQLLKSVRATDEVSPVELEAALLTLQECVGGDPAEKRPGEEGCEVESCFGPSLGGCEWELQAG